jgi:putative salt-induced outer membrane protein YdiY
MKGLYLGPYTSYSFRRQSTGNNGNNEITFNTFSAGAVVGAQFALGNRLFLDIFTGGGYRHSVDQFDATTYFGTLPQERRGIAAKGGFQLGVGF